jgi:putative copper export protein/mono/diheme cytochrome c family protein
MISAAVWQAGAVVAFGSSLFLARAGGVPPALGSWRAQVRTALLLCGGLAWCAGFAVLFDLALRITGKPLSFDAPELTLLLAHTRVGQVWAAKQILLSCLLAVLSIARWRNLELTRSIIALAALFLLLGLWAGHGGATEPILLNLPIHGIHILAAAGWLGALPSWAWLVWRVDDDTANRRYLGDALRAFSIFASIGMGVLALTGLVMAWNQFGAWPSFFGTVAGAALSVKLVLLAIALGCAWRLRRQFLHRLTDADAHDTRAALRLIGCEFAAATGVFMLALELAQMTPGAHQPITWWLPFRVAPDAAWAEPLSRWVSVAGVAALLCAFPAWRAHRIRYALALALGGLGAVVYGIAVPAFPDTYRQPTVAYSARSITKGAALFSTHCASCHGAGARGDERRLALEDNTAPPDLSEHTALHTAGDMFWWLTHGTPPGNMPAFGQVLSDTQRWHLINFLRAFADGHRARVLAPTVAPRQPWLGAPNFQYETSAGRSTELKAFRDQQPVLLILASLPNSTARLRALSAAQPTFTVADIAPLLALHEGDCAEISALGITLPCVRLGRKAVTFTYRLLARTLSDPGPRTELTPPATHAEYLIDRYGYLRARWIPRIDGDQWSDPRALVEQARALEQEPKILNSPDEHVH